jgi:hypothetical protein
MVCPAAKRSREAQTYLDQLCQIDADIARAHGLSQAFQAMVRERQGYGRAGFALARQRLLQAG